MSLLNKRNLADFAAQCAALNTIGTTAGLSGLALEAFLFHATGAAAAAFGTTHRLTAPGALPDDNDSAIAGVKGR